MTKETTALAQPSNTNIVVTGGLFSVDGFGIPVVSLQLRAAVGDTSHLHRRGPGERGGGDSLGFPVPRGRSHGVHGHSLSFRVPGEGRGGDGARMGEPGGVVLLSLSGTATEHVPEGLAEPSSTDAVEEEVGAAVDVEEVEDDGEDKAPLAVALRAVLEEVEGGVDDDVDAERQRAEDDGGRVDDEHQR